MKEKPQSLPNLRSSKRAHYLLMVIAAILVSIFFLWGVPHEAPMGDSYIHYLYARNLVVHKELSYNLGLEEGIGSSSILWVLVLAFFQVLGISPVVMAYILGVLLLTLSGFLVYELALQILAYQPGPEIYWKSLAITIMAVFSGSMVWLALSGMETMLFLTLGLLSLWFYMRGSWTCLGIALGLCALTRIEGVILAGVVVLVEFLRDRRIDLKLVKIITPLVLILAPWLVYLQMKEGMPFTTSFQGRQLVVFEVEKRIESQFPQLLWLLEFNPVVHFVSWTYFAMMYITGSVSLPGPVIYPGENLVGTELTLPIAGILIGLFCLPVVYLSLKHIFRMLKPFSLEVPGRRLLFVMVAWFSLFNLAYALFFPQIGAAGRYIPMNHMFFWICLFIGSTRIQKKRLKQISLLLVVLLFGISLNYWRTVFRLNIDYMVNVRIKAARYIDANYPPDLPVGATDLGAIGYYAQQPVVDLLGHINQDFNQFMAAGGSVPSYVVKERLCYLMLFGSMDGHGLDFSKEMGLSDDPRFGLTIDQSFSVPVDEWNLGSGPLRNYMPVVNVFQVNWRDGPVCPYQLGSQVLPGH